MNMDKLRQQDLTDLHVNGFNGGAVDLTANLAANKAQKSIMQKLTEMRNVRGSRNAVINNLVSASNAATGQE